MIAQWDSSLSVLPVAGVRIAQWDSSLSVLPVARVQFQATAEYFKGFFPGWSHSANPSWASVAENGSISPQWVTFSMGHAGASRKSPNDAPWETLSLRLSRPISAPLLTVARSWRHEKKSKEKAWLGPGPRIFWAIELCQGLMIWETTIKPNLWPNILTTYPIRGLNSPVQRGSNY